MTTWAMTASTIQLVVCLIVSLATERSVPVNAINAKIFEERASELRPPHGKKVFNLGKISGKPKQGRRNSFVLPLEALGDIW